MMKLGTFRSAALLLAGTTLAATAVAQTATNASQAGLNIPPNAQFLQPVDDGVRKATAIVNGYVITGTDVDHRVALAIAENGGEIPADQLPRLRAQMLRELIDETLQIQAAASRDIKIEQREIDSYFARYAQSNGSTPQQFAELLRRAGSSERSVKRQIQGNIAWSRLQQQKIQPFVQVSDDEVKSVIDRLNASKGTQEYRVGEIFLASNPQNSAEVRANAARIIQQIQQGAPFSIFARQFSEASTAAVGGDLGWVRAELLPEELSQAVRSMQIGHLSQPISVPGGYSIIMLVDKRQRAMPNPRDALLSLKQIRIDFPAGTSTAQYEMRARQLIEGSQNLGGCGRAEELGARLGATVVSNDQIAVRDLPYSLQEQLLQLDIGQSVPFGTEGEDVSVLVLCGRDDPETGLPSFDDVYASLNKDRTDRRAMRYLRDLRRDAVVEYR
jgi:peptidyl-prolyl cis-trans isomerase SurA